MPSALGKYRIVREVGRGGGGVVYEAEDRALGRTVALKMLRPAQHLSSEEEAANEERFLREARLAANLPKHPNLVGVYEAGLLEGRLYIAMEFVAGATLSEWRVRNSPPLRQQIAVLRQAALGVDHAHRHGIIHRDLKPANILVDAENQPRVADFGLAKSTRQSGSLSLTDQGMTVGTPAYMSPEQAEGRKSLDARADVWALGVILYELLTGRPPFRSASGIDLLVKIVKDPVPPPSTVIPEGPHAAIDPALENICLRALAKDRALRHPTARAFADDLEHWLRGEKVAPGTLRVAQAAGRRRSGHLAIAGAALAALLLSAVIAGTRSDPEPPGPAETPGTARARESLLQGRKFLAAGKPEEAYDRFARAADEDPSWPEPREAKRQALAELVRRAQGVGGPDVAPSVPAPRLGPGSTAEEAVRKARGFARENPSDVEGQLQAWREAAQRAKGSALADEAAGEARLALRRLEDLERRDLTDLDELSRLLGDAELFGPLEERLGALFHRYENPDWAHSISERRTALSKEVGDRYAGLRKRALEAKAAGNSSVSAGIRGRIRAWRWPGLLEDLDQALSEVQPAGPEASTAKPEPALGPASPPVPAPLPALDAARSAMLLPLEPASSHENGVTSVTFSPDGRWLLSGGHDKAVRLWDLGQRKEARSLELPAEVYAVAVSPDGRFIAASAENHVRLWDTTKFQSRPLEKHGALVTRIVFSYDSRTLATSGYDGIVNLWDVATASLQPAIDFYHPEGATGMDFSPNGKYLAVAAGDGSVRLWEVATRKARVLAEASGTALRSASFSPDGKWIATAGDGPNITLWDSASGRQKAIPTRSESPTVAVLFTPDSRILAAGSLDGNVRLWEVATGELRQTLSAAGACAALAFSRKGDFLAAGTESWRVRLWDATPMGISKKSK